MSRRVNRPESITDQQARDYIVRPTLDGRLKWRISRIGGWSTSIGGYRVYFGGGGLVYSPPVSRVAERWIYTISPQARGEIMEAIIFSREEQSDGE